MAHPYYLAPAAPDERIAHGACRPGYSQHSPTDSGPERIHHWTERLRADGVERVCCLLHRPQLNAYLDLLGEYERAFGAGNVLHAPIRDYRLADRDQLATIFAFLHDAGSEDHPTAVHCAAGLGRTGHVLSAWLAHDRAYEPERALSVVEEMGRTPREAVHCDNATEAELHELLEWCASLPPETAERIATADAAASSASETSPAEHEDVARQ